MKVIVNTDEEYVSELVGRALFKGNYFEDYAILSTKVLNWLDTCSVKLSLDNYNFIKDEALETIKDNFYDNLVSGIKEQLEYGTDVSDMIEEI